MLKVTSRYNVLLVTQLIHLLSSIVLESIVLSSVTSHALVLNWARAQRALQNPNCCVISVPGLDNHLKVLQKEILDKGTVDLDLRSRIRTASNPAATMDDCRQLLDSVIAVPTNNKNNKVYDQTHVDPCTAALEELARGVALLVPNELGKAVDVHMRVVCASDYRAVDPMFHTDKCPLRGYVTLRGVGTEYMSRPCSPVEYVSLRTLGKQPSGEPSGSLQQAKELEFIVMKGDYYPQPQVNTWLSKVWNRTFACVHRSPPGNGGRRIIISLDLADGMDDREWYDSGKKREWRSGMTQRKSRLVA